VIAVDIDARFLHDVDPKTVEVVEANVVTDPLPPARSTSCTPGCC
jgi:hypothetical protein